MDRVLQYLWDSTAQPSSVGQVWCLGQSYSDSTDEVWDAAFECDATQRVWLTYRTGFSPIERDPDGPSPLSLSNVLRTGALDPSHFTSDVGWGCMIRTGQSLLANALMILRHGRRPTLADELPILKLFADEPVAPLSLHKFVAHGAGHCGKKPGEWFGPSAVASCIRALVESADPALDLGVYISDGMDVYEDDVREKLTKYGAVLVLCGLRLGISNVNPLYYPGLRLVFEIPQSIGIAGGRTSASLYFYGIQSERLFYHDPHEPLPALRVDSPAKAYDSVHSRRLRALPLNEMDPSMLVGFLLRSEEDISEWESRLASIPEQSRVILVHKRSAATAAAASLSRDSATTQPDEEADGFVLCAGDLPDTRVEDLEVSAKGKSAGSELLDLTPNTSPPTLDMADMSVRSVNSSIVGYPDLGSSDPGSRVELLGASGLAASQMSDSVVLDANDVSPAPSLSEVTEELVVGLGPGEEEAELVPSAGSRYESRALS